MKKWPNGWFNGIIWRSRRSPFRQNTDTDSPTPARLTAICAANVCYCFFASIRTVFIYLLLDMSALTPQQLRTALQKCKPSSVDIFFWAKKISVIWSFNMSPFADCAQTFFPNAIPSLDFVLEIFCGMSFYFTYYVSLIGVYGLAYSIARI